MRLWSFRPALPVLIVVSVAMATGLVPAQAAGPPGWRIVATVSASADGTELTAIAPADQRHAWAVGIDLVSNSGTFAPVVMGWNGSAWTQVSLPAGIVADLGAGPLLDAAAASSPSNMWAFTAGGGWLRWNGQWTAGRIAQTPIDIDSTLVFGPSDVWAFGSTLPKRGASTPYAAHYDGAGGWKRYSVPGTAAIGAASAVNSNDIWATLGRTEFADSGRAVGGLVHWFRGSWHRVTGLPAQLRTASLGSVLARSDKDVWVGGAVKDAKGGSTEVVGRWNGRKWTVSVLRARATSNGYSMIAMVTDGAGGIWGLGNCLASANCSAASPWRLWHETGGNKWSRPIEPRLSSHDTLLSSLAPVAHSVWASGAIREGSGANGIVVLWGNAPS